MGSPISSAFSSEDINVTLKAILATRLALQFTCTQAATLDDIYQVENHMRLCLAIEDNNETVITVSPSEPLLAEGAYRALSMQKRSQADLLLQVLQGPSLHKGDRGETVALLLFLEARDAAVRLHKTRNIKLLDFLQALLCSSPPRKRGVDIGLNGDGGDDGDDDVNDDGDDDEDTEYTDEEEPHINCKNEFLDIRKGFPRHLRVQNDDVLLESCFKHAEMHFNHFIRVRKQSSMNVESLYKLVGRGAAILCPVNQVAVDVIIPFVINAKQPVGPTNVSAILCQVRNNAQYTTKINRTIFNEMDPFRVGVFSTLRKQVAVPVIRMVMALASPRPGIAIVNSERQNPVRATRNKASGTSKSASRRFTAYDIWCARACSQTFKVIRPKEDGIYRKLLLLENGVFPECYESKFNLGEDEIEDNMIESATRSMVPGDDGDVSDHYLFAEVGCPFVLHDYGNYRPNSKERPKGLDESLLCIQ